ncbi:MAG: metal ABC transporter solute-binding protein, Zn/Mn family, partial [Cyanobium sp.]
MVALPSFRQFRPAPGRLSLAVRLSLAAILLGSLAGCVADLRPPTPTDRTAARPPASPAPRSRSLFRPVSRPGETPPLRVVTTVLPVGLFTQAVAGSCAEVEALLPANADLHDLPVSPQLVGRLRGADVLVFNGLGLEAPLEQLLAGGDGPRPRTIIAAAGLDPLPAAEGGHAYVHAHVQAHAHESSADSVTRVNPHVWLDPRRAAGQVRAIRDGLTAA